PVAWSARPSAATAHHATEGSDRKVRHFEVQPLLNGAPCMSRLHAVDSMTGNPELLRTVRSARRRLAEVGSTRARSEGDFERVALPDHDADVLRDLLVAEGVRVVVEIGLAYGRSALAIAEALLTVGNPNPNHVI